MGFGEVWHIMLWLWEKCKPTVGGYNFRKKRENPLWMAPYLWNANETSLPLSSFSSLILRYPQPEVPVRLYIWYTLLLLGIVSKYIFKINAKLTADLILIKQIFYLLFFTLPCNYSDFIYNIIFSFFLSYEWYSIFVWYILLLVLVKMVFCFIRLNLLNNFITILVHKIHCLFSHTWSIQSESKF